MHVTHENLEPRDGTGKKNARTYTGTHSRLLPTDGDERFISFRMSPGREEKRIDLRGVAAPRLHIYLGTPRGSFNQRRRDGTDDSVPWRTPRVG